MSNLSKQNQGFPTLACIHRAGCKSPVRCQQEERCCGNEAISSKERILQLVAELDYASNMAGYGDKPLPGYAEARQKARQSLDDAIRSLPDETKKERQLSATDRLHNLCDALSEQANESPFSREEWERVDRDTAEKNRRIEHLEFVLRGFYWDQVDYIKRNNLGGMNNHWMRATRVALCIHPDDPSPVETSDGVPMDKREHQLSGKACAHQWEVSPYTDVRDKCAKCGEERLR